ncbi:hypothetical protein PsYK624_015630 [Phanerochaete sordida]|uniref:Uncharacterized protein n=1 Tax=Phanerochaete sordida TaxID=48140 RepID=A0A9P3G045_9APHY|nr:hypothetical protein PsYK624_015630 [Phanerochaete sordida]
MTKLTYDWLDGQCDRGLKQHPLTNALRSDTTELADTGPVAARPSNRPQELTPQSRVGEQERARCVPVSPTHDKSMPSRDTFPPLSPRERVQFANLGTLAPARIQAHLYVMFRFQPATTDSSFGFAASFSQ